MWRRWSPTPRRCAPPSPTTASSSPPTGRASTTWTTPRCGSTIFNTAFAKGRDRRGDAEPSRLDHDSAQDPRTLPRRPHQVLENCGHRSPPEALCRHPEPHHPDHRRARRQRTLHRELEHFVEAGLTPYQALATATRNPAEFLKASREWGTIEPGKRADLVLIAGNPLEDIRNTSRIEAVSMGGRWLPRPELQRMIASASDRLDGRETSSRR
ncbi:MAG: amidohydrolase family protein [Gemmatimonadales bacterium]|nr:amidohydrolase family protein [Gemmatimonadales bacterium]